jgi:hypothetical protein
MILERRGERRGTASAANSVLEPPPEARHRCNDGNHQDEFDQTQHAVLLVQRGETLVVGLIGGDLIEG